MTAPTLLLSAGDGRPPPHRVLGRLFLPADKLAAIDLDPALGSEADRIGLWAVLELAQRGYEIRALGEGSGLHAFSAALAEALGQIDELAADLAACRAVLDAAARNAARITP